MRKLVTGNAPALGIIASVPSVPCAQALAQAGFDWLMIDLEHAPIGPSEMQEMIAATCGTSCLPIVRVPVDDSDLTKKALDAGAAGIVFPMIRTAEQAAAAVAKTRYPPAGTRGWGPFLATVRWNLAPAEYLLTANDELTRIVLIEHPEALINLEAILAVEGIDVALVAPNDLALNMGFPGQVSHPEVQAAIDSARDLINGTGVNLGGVASSMEDAKGKVKQGFRVLVLGYELKMLQDRAREMLALVRQQ